MKVTVCDERIEDLLRDLAQNLIDHFESPGFWPLDDTRDLALCLREVLSRRRSEAAEERRKADFEEHATEVDRLTAEVAALRSELEQLRACLIVSNPQEPRHE